MSDQLPVPVSPEDEENDAKYQMMSGKAGLEVFCAELRELGVELPPREVWKYAKRKDIEASVHATFSMLGGVPGMALWAHKNPNLFYPAYIKLAPAESVLGQGGNIFINTSVPESDLDSIEIDAKTGKIKNFKDIDDV